MKALFTDIDGVLNSASSAEMYFAFLKHDDPGMNRFYNSSDLIKFKPNLGPDCTVSEFCPLAVSNYNYILREVPDLKVVISSYWRLGRSIEDLQSIFKWLGLPHDRIIGKTPSIHGVQRGVEIKDWLSKNPEVTKYAVIDDDSDMDVIDPGCFFHIDSYNGLIYTQALEIIKHFKN